MFINTWCKNGLVDDYDDALARSYIVCIPVTIEPGFFFSQKVDNRFAEIYYKGIKKRKRLQMCPLERDDSTVLTLPPCTRTWPYRCL